MGQLSTVRYRASSQCQGPVRVTLLPSNRSPATFSSEEDGPSTIQPRMAQRARMPQRIQNGLMVKNNSTQPAMRVRIRLAR